MFLVPPCECRLVSPSGVELLALAAAGFLASSAIVRVVRRWALARGVMDTPNPRSSHAVPTPRGGGWAIAAPTMFFLLLWPLISDEPPAPRMLGLVGGAAMVVAVSWLDDLRSVGTGARLLVHTLAAVVALQTLGTGPLGDLHLGGVDLRWVGWVFALGWIVGLTNAYNFMDGIDGLAGGQAVLAGAGWAAAGWMADQPLIAGLGAMLAATSAGFLWLNWAPAKIFLGDVGSTFLGYTYAVLPLLAASPGAGGALRAAPLVGALLVWPFVFDSVFTLLRRVRAGENVFAAHRSHLYQRLTQAGRSHRFVAGLYLGLAAIGVAAAVLCVGRHPAAFAAMAAVPVSAVWLWRLVVRSEGSGQILERSRVEGNDGRRFDLR